MKIKGTKIFTKRTAALITAGAAVFFALFLAGLLFFSANYQNFYGHAPAAKDGVLDFEGYSVSAGDVDSLLEGEWEFFYGRWIVTDGDTAESDGLIPVPGRWTGRETNGTKLPRSGYASYRLRLKNVEAGIPLLVFRVNYHTPYRVYLNGQLNVRSGEPSRERGGNFASGVVDEGYPYTSDGGDIEVVVELGYSETGGLNATPWLSDRSGANVRGRAMSSFALSLFGFAAAVVLASVMITAGPNVVAAYNTDKIEELMQNKGIIRNRNKIAAAIENARAFLKVQQEFGSFDAFIWSFTDGKVVDHHLSDIKNMPAKDELSEKVSAALKKRGFKFVGPTIVYSYLQGIGVINDHWEYCDFR